MTVALGRDTTYGVGTSTTAGTTLAVTHGVVDVGETLIVGIVCDNVTSAALPTVSSITKDGAETASWVLIGSVDSSSATGAAGVRGMMYAITAAVRWAAGSKTITFSASITAKAAEARVFYGVTTTARGTVPSGTSGAAGVSTGGAPTATTAGTVIASGDLVMGINASETNAVVAVDTDTLNGSWVGFGAGTFTTGGAATSNVSVRAQYKIATASGAQTLNPTSTGDCGVAVVGLVPQALSSVTATRAATWDVAALAAVQWTDDTFANMNGGGNYTLSGDYSYPTDGWYYLIPPPGIRESLGYASIASVRLTALASQNQYVKVWMTNRRAGWFLKVRCSSTPGGGTNDNGATFGCDGGNILWWNNAGTLINAIGIPGGFPTGPGFVELRVVSNICSLISGGVTHATYDISAAGITGLYTGFGSKNGGVILYAEGGDIGGTGVAPSKVTGMLATSITATQIDVTWAEPANGGQAITGYKIERAPDAAGSPGTWATLVADTASPYPRSYSDLTVTVGQRWWYRVSAINSIGTGTVSDPDDAIATAPAPPAFTENFASGLRMWTIARWHSQGTQGGNFGYVPSSSNDDGHYDGVLGAHTTPTGPGILPPYDIFVGTNNYLFVGGGAQNYGDTFLRCAQQMDLTGNGPWKIRLGIIPNPNGIASPPGGLGLCGWTTLYITDKPMASPSMTTDNSFGPVPQYGFSVRLDGSNDFNGANSTYYPSPTSFTYNNFTETGVGSDGKYHNYTLSTTSPVEVELTFTRSWLYITSDGAPWAAIPWTLPTALTSGWLYLGAHNHATRKYPQYSDSRSAVYTHIEFDGPVIAPQYSYAVPDNTQTTAGGGEVIGEATNNPGPFPGVNTGWGSPTPTLVIPNVPANVSAAKLIMSSHWTVGYPDDGTSYYVRYSLNGNATHDVQTNFKAGSGSFSYAIQVSPAELVTGDNTLNITMIGQVGSFPPYLGNISLLVEAFSTGKVAIGSIVVSTLMAGATAIKALNLGAIEIWRAPLPPQVPTAPTLITLTPGASGELAARWSQPVDRGAAITDYVVQYRTSPSGTWTAFSHSAQTTRTLTITGLSAVAYDVRVASINSVGTGGWSNLLTTTAPGPASVPFAPTLNSATPGDTTMALAWTAGSNGGAAITNYVIEYRTSPAGSWNTFSHSASTVTSITVTGLTNSTAYDFRVSAVNSVGTGTASNVLTATPAAGGGLVLYTDNFDRGNGAIGSPWVASDGGLAVISNKCGAPDSGLHTSRYNQTFAADQWAEGDMVWAHGGAIVGPCVRFTAGGDFYYFWFDGSDHVEINKRVSGSYSTIAGSVVTVAPFSFKARMEVQGTTFRAYIDGVLAFTGTDSSIATGQPGILAANGTNGSIDNFRCGNMPYVPPLPTVVAATWATVAPDVVTVNKPAGGTLGTGDYYVIWFETGDWGTSPPTASIVGFTADPAGMQGISDGHGQWFWRAHTGSEGSSFTVTCSTAGHWGAPMCWLVRGAPGGWTPTPGEAIGSTGGADMVFPSVRALDNTLMLVAYKDWNALLPSARPASWTLNTATGNSLNGYSLGVAAAADIGPYTITPSAGNTRSHAARLFSRPVAFSDNFNRANGVLGPAWLGQRVGIVSNKAAVVDTSGSDFMTFAQSMGSADHWIEADIAILGTSDYMVINARRPDKSNGLNGYLLFVNPGSGGSPGVVTLGKMVSGAYNDLAYSAGNGSTPSKIRLECQGSNIRGYINGTKVIDITDTSFTTGIYVGLNTGIGAVGNYDNFRCGPLPYIP